MSIILASFCIGLWSVAISRPLSQIVYIFESRFSFNSVDLRRYTIICSTGYFDSLKAHNIVHRYFAYHLHIYTSCHLQKVLVGSFLYIDFTYDGIFIYVVSSLICIHMQLKLISLDIAISFITLDVQCIFSGDVFINFTCQS